MNIYQNKDLKVSINPVSIVTLILVFCLPFEFTGQQKQGLDRDHNEQVTIIGTYDPTINQAFKINTKPEVNPIVVQQPDFTFQSLDVLESTTVAPKDIKLTSIRTGRKVTVYNNYLKAGFGSWLTPYLDYFHSSGERNDYRLFVNIYHLSSFKDIPDYSPSPFSNTLAKIGYEKYAGKSIINFGVSYGLDTYRYYGFKPSDYPEITFDEDKLKQMFNLVRANLGVRSNNKKKEDFEYDLNLSTYYYFDKWKTSEVDVDLDFDFAKPFKASKKGNNQKVGLEGTVDYGINNDTTKNIFNLVVTGIPYFKAKYGIFSFRAGVDLSYLIADSSKFYVFPIVDLAVVLVPEALTVYAGVDGGLIKNSYLGLTTVNPWVTSVIPINWQRNKLRAFGGLRGNIARQLGFNIEVSWLNFENMPFFINITDDPIWPSQAPLNKFTTTLDNGTVFTISGELTYSLARELKLWLSGAYNIYSLDSLAQPYHKPISKIGLGGSYLIKKKVNIRAGFYSYGKRYAVDILTVEPAQIELDGFFDINVGLDYYVNDKLSVFLNGTNLLNNNYERFYNYPVQGLQVMAGIGFRF